MKRRGSHSARDERRIDRLQGLATERVGRGAAVSVDRSSAGHKVVVFDARGDERVVVVGEDKARTLEAAIGRLLGGTS